MSLFLANPWGLAALAAVPALLVIHTLRQRSRRIRSSTLFLIEHAGVPPAGGLRLERLRRSVPLALQILAAAAIAWLLAEPRWIATRPRQTVAVVLDGSASMQAFREPAREALEKALRRIDRAARRTDWHLLQSGPRQAPLYAGDRLDDLFAALAGWQPVLGTHDPAPALATAAGLVPGGRGTVLFLTDRTTRVPDTVGLLTVGTPIDNVGFAAGDVVDRDGTPHWRAVITNPGAVSQERSLRVRVPGATAEAALPIRLEPGQHRTVEATWPTGAERVELDLSPDRFTFDDILPLVRPRPRRVRVAVRLEGPTGDLLGRMLAAAPAVDLVAPGADADLVVDDWKATPTTAAILVPPATTGDATAPTYAASPVAAEDHPLVSDLGWGGLLSGEPLPVDDRQGDQPLLWKGQRPLALVRSTVAADGARRESLLLAWDLAASTAARLPALVVLLERFVDRVRSRLDRPWADNFPVDALIDMPVSDGTLLTVEPPGAPAQAAEPFRGRAPARPALFAVGTTGVPPRLVAAAQATDARESDFRDASTGDTLTALHLEQRRKEAILDPWGPLWLALIAAALAGAWGWPAWSAAGRRSTRPAA
jgi:hypothetical protein